MSESFQNFPARNTVPSGIHEIEPKKAETVFVVTNTAPFQMREGEVQPSMGMPRAIVDFMGRASSGDFHWMYVGDNEFKGHTLNGDLHAVSITPEEKIAHYQQISNKVLWQVMHAEPHNTLRPSKELSEDPKAWDQYLNVCSKVATNIHLKIESLTRDEYPPIIWIHDYQMLAIAQELKNLRHGAKDIPIGMYWHIPFSEVDMLIQELGEEKVRQILIWLSGYDVIGFHIQEYAQNYQNACKRFGIKGANTTIQPISVDVEGIKSTAKQIASSHHEFEDPNLNEFFEIEAEQNQTNKKIRLVCGMERCDITKGTIERLEAWKLILSTSPEILQNIHVLEVIVPSRITIEEYHVRYTQAIKLMEEINALAEVKLGRPLITHSEGINQRKDVIAAGVFSDGFIVTPIKDGYNMAVAEAAVAQLVKPQQAPALLATEATGFYKSLQEHGAESAISVIRGPITPQTIQAGISAFIRKILNPKDSKANHKNELEQYFNTFSIQKWVQESLRTIGLSHKELGTLDRTAPIISAVPKAHAL